jgi:cell pole-organizing protein PopZ
MEEILASIRRIIADDQALFVGPGASRSEGSQAAPKIDAGAADLGRRANDSRQDGGPRSAGSFIAAKDEDSLRGVHHRDGEKIPREALPFAEVIAGAEPIVSVATDGSVASAFHTLVASRLVQDSDKFAALTRELIRPMLKAWLDENLPAIVERLVSAEIERVARGD